MAARAPTPTSPPSPHTPRVHRSCSPPPLASCFPTGVAVSAPEEMHQMGRRKAEVAWVPCFRSAEDLEMAAAAAAAAARYMWRVWFLRAAAYVRFRVSETETLNC
ncbi:hypothetical protein GUJ93_ZPchr0010g7230 [Zizania palustris]|uniref:Uncharacterized protein n=1 Tax=Zizania palustris TaxID=103762 RepID=A0A8J5WBA6_ZIZPA|nr:hypothetical protein GUJ93_ZPchr0010g7230 [Zizania palustris]